MSSADKPLHILIGITGGIAAYKIPELVRKLRENGAIVRVVMTKAAKEFISPLTLQAVSGQPVNDSLLDPAQEAAMGHIALARWADKVLIAPASANFIAELAHGFAGDLLSTLCLATEAPIFVAPAMNRIMWHATATQDNIRTLIERGICILPPEEGEQACGEVGPGRLPDTTTLLNAVLSPSLGRSMTGMRVLITAGPTQEPIDPIRFISNHSSGKMGYALAIAAQAAGADVTLISGPTALPKPCGVKVINITTAQEMFDAVMKHLKTIHIFIATAAVADYRPSATTEQKMKREGTESLSLTFTQNPDILSTVAAQPNPPFTVGFAAETQDVLAYAHRKLQTKGIDAICANDVSDPQIGFNSNDNEVTLITTTGEYHFSKTTKTILAHQLINKIAECYHDKQR